MQFFKQEKNNNSDKLDGYLRTLAKWFKDIESQPQWRELKDINELIELDFAALATELDNECKQIGSKNLSVRAQFLSTLIAYKNAEQMLIAYCSLQQKHPQNTVDIYVLKRHDESNHIHKALGLNQDTGLTALCSMPIPAKQTIAHLKTAKIAHSACAEALKACGLIQSIEMHVSPVSRSYQTAEASTFESHIPDSTYVDIQYAETTGSGIKGWLSRSSIPSDEKIAAPLIRSTLKQFKNLTIGVLNHPSNSREKLSEDKRVAKAVNTFIHTAPAQPGASMRVLVAHGGINRAMMKQLKANAQEYSYESDIPSCDDNLNYGGYYSLYVARDSKGKIIEIAHGGKFSRYGVLENQPSPTIEYDNNRSILGFDYPC